MITLVCLFDDDIFLMKELLRNLDSNALTLCTPCIKNNVDYSKRGIPRNVNFSSLAVGPVCYIYSICDLAHFNFYATIRKITTFTQ